MNEILVVIGVIYVMAIVLMFYIMNVKIKYLEDLVEMYKESLKSDIKRVNKQIEFEQNSRQIGDNILHIKNGITKTDVIDLIYKVEQFNKKMLDKGDGK